MANVTGGARNHALVKRVTALSAAVATAVTVLCVVIAGAGSSAAQINIGAIVCPILLALKAIFGSFFGLGAIFDALLTAFGCNVSGG